MSEDNRFKIKYNVSTIDELRNKKRVKFKSKAWSYSKRAFEGLAAGIVKLYLPALGPVGEFSKNFIWDKILFGKKLDQWLTKAPIAKDAKEQAVIQKAEELAQAINVKFRGRDIKDMKIRAEFDAAFNSCIPKLQETDFDLALAAFVHKLDKSLSEYLVKNRLSDETKPQPKDMIIVGDFFAHQEQKEGEDCIVVYVVTEIKKSQEKKGSDKITLVSTEDNSTKLEVNSEELISSNDWEGLTSEDVNSLVEKDNEITEVGDIQDFISSYEDVNITDSYGNAFVNVQSSENAINIVFNNGKNQNLSLTFDVGDSIICNTMKGTHMQNLYKINSFKKGSEVSPKVLQSLIEDMSNNLLSQDKEVISKAFKAFLPQSVNYSNPNEFFNDLNKALKSCDPSPSDDLLLTSKVIPEKWKDDWEKFTSSSGSHDIEVSPPDKDYYASDKKGAFEDLIDFAHNKNISLSEAVKYVPSKYKKEYLVYIKGKN